ncbi:MAG: hypothetical protein IT285_03115 [Bdellovibrionales bacterium]|nr:hypothetical protein [Bdellovibrionales bacterium]
MKTIHTLFLTLAVSASLLGSPASQAGSWEDYTLLAMHQREMAFFGIDADVRRMLNDSNFEDDLRKWWLAVNPLYIEDAVRGQYDDENIPEAAENRAFAQRSNLQRTANDQYNLRLAFAQHMNAAIPSEKAQIYLAYFLRTGQKDKARSLLRIYAQEFALWAREILQDPRYPSLGAPAAATQALQRAAALLDGDISRYKQCQTQSALGAKGECLAWNAQNAALKGFADCSASYTGISSVSNLAACLKGQIAFTSGWKDLAEAARWPGPAHAAAGIGFLGGNDVTYLTRNRQDSDYVEHFESLYAGTKDPVAQVPGAQTVDQIVALINSGRLPFTGTLFPRAENHPTFALNDSIGAHQAIFPQMVQAIRTAKHTVFMDMFFIGGTVGVVLGQELIAAADRGVKVYLLHDPYNPFNYGPEIRPVFNWLMAYSRQNPTKMVAAGSYVFAHRTGLPAYFDALIPDHVVESLMRRGTQVFSFLPPLFPKAKSDHSKVMVIDGAGAWTDSVPVAFVGSKNWTDSSGAMTFDEVAKVTGPAAVATQDSYYWDFWYALKAGGHGREPMDPAAIETALAAFDPLARKWDASKNRVVPTRAELAFVSAIEPNLSVRIGQNNIDGSETSALDQNIAAIRMAKKQIVVNDQFLYDRRVVEELLDKARTSPEVMIYVMLEPISKSSGVTAEPLGGFPNTLYADLLMYKELEVNDAGQIARRVAWPNIRFKWKHVPHSDEFHMEYHMKTITVDGFNAQGARVASGPALLISGSANKDHMTMHGAFRETQLEIWDGRGCAGTGPAARCGAVAEADRIFWARWNNQLDLEAGGGSKDADAFRFQVPPELQQVFTKVLRRDMTPAEFLLFARSLIHGAYELEEDQAVE